MHLTNGTVMPNLAQHALKLLGSNTAALCHSVIVASWTTRARIYSIIADERGENRHAYCE